MGGVGIGGRLLLVGLGLGLVGCSQALQPPAEPDAATEAAANTEHMAGAVTALRPTAADRVRYTDMQQYLQGRVAGLQVIPQGNGQYALRLRGTTSLNMTNEPLVVIDGVPVPPEGVSNALAVVTPDMVKSVEVLKDAGSTAWYGIRGANGVIVITTLRGSDR